MDSTLQRLADAKYVRLTTFRRDGTPVPTPVWLVADGAALLVTTVSSTGKVKRIRHTPRVLLAPSDNRGRVADGVPDVEATATLVDDPAELERLAGLLRRRYGLFYRALTLVGRLRGTGQDIEIRITLPS